MSICRICLESKRNLCSIFECDEGLSYASMVTLVTGIKIMKDSHDMICLLCRRKLKEFYEFKELIEQSELELSKQSRIFKFNTIDDIKIEFLPDLDYEFTAANNTKAEYEKFLKCEINSFYYNDTHIRKLAEKKTIPVEELLNSMKLEEFEDFKTYVDDSRCDMGNDEKHSSEKKKKRKSKSEKHKKSDESQSQMNNNVRIKPIFLNDVRVLKTTTNVLRKRKTYSKIRRDEICPFCGKITKSMRTHLLTHSGERKFKCSECPRTFYTEGLLTYHARSHSSRSEIFKCDHCISTFNSRSAVTRHMAIHTEDRRYSCEICKKGFRWRHRLTHDARAARAERCGECGRAFRSRAALRHHARVHSGERPYRCELCSQPYSYKRDFNRHCLKKHGVIVDRRPVYVMNEEVLRRERVLMKDLMLRLRGLPTETDPMESFRGPQKALAFAKAVRVMQNGQLPVDAVL